MTAGRTTGERELAPGETRLAYGPRRLGCAQVHLDSAPHRHPAHRLNLSEGYHISSFHFSRNV